MTRASSLSPAASVAIQQAHIVNQHVLHGKEAAAEEAINCQHHPDAAADSSMMSTSHHQDKDIVAGPLSAAT